MTTQIDDIKPYAEGAPTTEPRFGDVVTDAEGDDYHWAYLPEHPGGKRKAWQLLFSGGDHQVRFSREDMPENLAYVTGWNLEPDDAS